MGAEKFRALAVRLDDMRRHHQLKSLQVTSSVINEGKSFVAANLAVTLAKYSGSKTLLIEGDLHRPTLASMLRTKGFARTKRVVVGTKPGTSHASFCGSLARLYRSCPRGRPATGLQRSCVRRNLRKPLQQFASRFDWIVVDSTPMLPVIDANLWSRLVDGTLLVVREGVAPLKALKNGLQSLDNPKLIGVVMNEASDFDQIEYDGQYYGAQKNGDKGLRKAR